jgi:hypothetical protein
MVEIGPRPGPDNSNAVVVPGSRSSSRVRSDDIRFHTIGPRGRGRIGTRLIFRAKQRSGPIRPNHSSRVPKLNDPISARHRSRRSSIELTGSHAVWIGGIGNSSEWLIRASSAAADDAGSQLSTARRIANECGGNSVSSSSTSGESEHSTSSPQNGTVTGSMPRLQATVNRPRRMTIHRASSS